MSTIKCNFCQAENTTESDRCYSCNAPLPKRTTVQGKDKENLTNYILSVEKMLEEAKKKANSKVFLVFFLLSIFWLIISFVAYKFFSDDKLMIIILAVVLGLVLFIVFGGFIISLENRAITKTYNEKIKNDIAEYLTVMHYNKIDFKIVASEVLKEKSNLIKFLDDF